MKSLKTWRKKAIKSRLNPLFRNLWEINFMARLSGMITVRLIAFVYIIWDAFGTSPEHCRYWLDSSNIIINPHAGTYSWINNIHLFNQSTDKSMLVHCTFFSVFAPWPGITRSVAPTLRPVGLGFDRPPGTKDQSTKNFGYLHNFLCHCLVAPTGHGFDPWPVPKTVKMVPLGQVVSAHAM